MPGIEAMAQLGGIAMLCEQRDKQIVALVRAVADFAMERTLGFGQRIDLCAEVGPIRGPFAEVKTSASAGGESVASAPLAYALPGGPAGAAG